MSIIPKKPSKSTHDHGAQFKDLALFPISKNKSGLSVHNAFWEGVSQESYVDAQRVAEYLSLARREVLKLTRAGKLPAHVIDPRAARKSYRYRLSEIDNVLSQGLPAEQALGFRNASGHNDHRQPRDQRG